MQSNPISLFYTHAGSGGKKIMILHGLFGSERNWTSVVKELATVHTVVVPDLRNHGQSPHHPEHSIAAMREDIQNMADVLGWSSFILSGHSMGGLVAMDFAFHYPARVKGLIIEDIAPRAYPSDRLLDMIGAMKRIPLDQTASKAEVERMLKPDIPDPVIRQFLLTNLQYKGNHLIWRLNLNALEDFLRRDFRTYHSESIYFGPALFIGGARSPYRIADDTPLIRQHFPNAEIIILEDAGHWLHYEKKEAFLELIRKFLARLND